MSLAPAPLKLKNGEPARSAWSLSEDLQLNHGSFGAVPLVAQQLQQRYREQMEKDPVLWFVELADKMAIARSHLAQRLGVEKEKLALVPNATAGTTSVFHSLTLNPGSELLITNHGYGAVNMGAERLARRCGAKITIADIPVDADKEQAVAALASKLTERTELLVVDQITSPTALGLPVREITELAKKKGVRVLVDAAHAPGMIDRPLEGLGADYWTGNFHKWGCAPRGCAALVANSSRNEELYPIIDSWGSPYPYPERFDHQGTIDATSYLAASASWDFIEENFGWDSARIYMAQLAAYGQELLANAFTKLTGEDHSSPAKLEVAAMKLVKLPKNLVQSGDEAGELRNQMIREHGSHNAFTFFEGQGYLRISAQVYNTPKDYEIFSEKIVPILVNQARGR